VLPRAHVMVGMVTPKRPRYAADDEWLGRMGTRLVMPTLENLRGNDDLAGFEVTVSIPVAWSGQRLASSTCSVGGAARLIGRPLAKFPGSSAGALRVRWHDRGPCATPRPRHRTLDSRHSRLVAELLADGEPVHLHLVYRPPGGSEAGSLAERALANAPRLTRPLQKTNRLLTSAPWWSANRPRPTR